MNRLVIVFTLQSHPRRRIVTLRIASITDAELEYRHGGTIEEPAAYQRDMTTYRSPRIVRVTFLQSGKGPRMRVSRALADQVVVSKQPSNA